MTDTVIVTIILIRDEEKVEEKEWCGNRKKGGKGESGRRRRNQDRSSVGQTESWRAKDKRGEGDRGYWVCVKGGRGNKKKMG